MEGRVSLSPHRAKRAAGAASAFVVLALLGPAASADEPSKLECVRANETAQSLRQSGKLRDARAQLLVCIATSCPGPVRSDCADRLKEVDKATPTIAFDVTDASGVSLSAVAVTADGVAFAASLDGTAMPIDPGEHVFRFSSEGLRPLERTFVLREGERGRRESIVLGEASPTAPPRAPVAPSSAPEGATSSPQRAIGLVTGGVGIVGVIVGSVLGLVAKSTYSGAVSTCPNGPPSPCSQQGVNESGTAHSEATASTVAFIAGGALLAGGAAIYLTAPREGDVSVGPTAFVGGGGLGLRGTW
jgi:hypothetical protein